MERDSQEIILLRFIDKFVDPRCFNDLCKLQIFEGLSKINSKISKICLSLVLMDRWTWSDEVSLSALKTWTSWWGQWESQAGMACLFRSALQLQTHATYAVQKYKPRCRRDTSIPSFHWFYSQDGNLCWSWAPGWQLGLKPSCSLILCRQSAAVALILQPR